MIIRASLILNVVIVLTGCSMHKTQVDVSAEIQRIREADRALLQAESERNLDDAMEIIATDAVFQPPDAPPVVGATAIRAFYDEWFKIPYREIVCMSDTVIISSASDLAYVVGNSRIILDTPDGVTGVPGKYFTIWRKIDGLWLCVAVSWSGNQITQ
jgi:ketosteroid isomerase-like protein